MSQSLWDASVVAAFDEAARRRTVEVDVGGHTAAVPAPFPSPGDWRDHWIYFLLVDRFDNPSRPPRRAPFDGEHDLFQGGKLEGIRRRLGYLSELGAGALWLSPVLQNCPFEESTYHGYGIQNFLQVEPRFTLDPVATRADPSLGDRELRRLVDEAHAHGLYVIFDIVLNHAGNVFEYDGHGAEAPFSHSPRPIHWRDADGAPAFSSFAAAPEPLSPDAAVWPRELHDDANFRRQGVGGEAAGDFASLKELVTARRVPSPFGDRLPVRETLIRAYQYAIARFDVDGFRIDTLKYIEPDFARTFGNAMREFALSIGKRDFFTFGEVFDGEDKIAQFVGRDAGLTEEPIGIDAALDFPLFFALPSVAKGFAPPSRLAELYAHRKSVQRGLTTSHGEASSHFVTFLDNHDMRERFYFDDGQGSFDAQLTLGVTVLFALQGIPCLYYGTEQGLAGRGGSDRAVREALWGKPGAFDPNHSFYRTIRELSRVRAAEPALRYGRQYFRQLSGNGVDFGLSTFAPGVIAVSRILNDREVVVVANATQSTFSGELLVDASLCRTGDRFEVLFANLAGAAPPAAVVDKAPGGVRIIEPHGGLTHGPARALPLRLRAMEAVLLARARG